MPSGRILYYVNIWKTLSLNKSQIISLHTVLLIAMTVPLEDRVAAAHNLETARYVSLMSACDTNGFKAIHFAVEVGSRGFVAHSLLTCLRQLGFFSILV